MLFHVIPFSSSLTSCYAGQSDGCLVYDTYGTLIFWLVEHAWHIDFFSMYGTLTTATFLACRVRKARQSPKFLPRRACRAHQRIWLIGNVGISFIKLAAKSTK